LSSNFKTPKLLPVTPGDQIIIPGTNNTIKVEEGHDYFLFPDGSLLDTWIDWPEVAIAGPGEWVSNRIGEPVKVYARRWAYGKEHPVELTF
jgi:hypothetical protein